jgi:hypothetical protein
MIMGVNQPRIIHDTNQGLVLHAIAACIKWNALNPLGLYNECAIKTLPLAYC